MSDKKIVQVAVPENIRALIDERKKLLCKKDFRRGDGTRLHQVQILLSSHFCDFYERAVQ